jgi:hypothetical protein
MERRPPEDLRHLAGKEEQRQRVHPFVVFSGIVQGFNENTELREHKRDWVCSRTLWTHLKKRTMDRFDQKGVVFRKNL